MCVCVCGVHAGENANELTLPEQGDKIFDSSEYNGFGRLARSPSPFFYLLFNWTSSVFNLSETSSIYRILIIQISGKDLSTTVPKKIPLDMMLGLLNVKCKIPSLFCLSFWIVNNLSSDRPFMGIEIYSGISCSVSTSFM